VASSGCTALPGLVCNNMGSIGVLLGNGDGTFKPVVNYGSGTANAVSVVAGDINGDGKPDLVVANACVISMPTGNINCSTVNTLLGNGDGTFQPAIVNSTPEFLLGQLAVEDLDGDRKLDVVCGTTFGTDFILFGNGDGTFQPAMVTRIGGVAQGLGGVGEGAGVAITDLNGDGKLDVVSSGVTVLLSIRPPVSSTLLTSSAMPSYLNQQVTFAATVSGQGATPTGSVLFQISVNKPVTVPLVNGQATFSWTFAKTGPRTVTARYLGDGTHAPSSSNVVAQPVNALSVTTTMLTASLNPSMVEQAVTYTATVRNGIGIPA
jgi:hypothetical protein